MAIKRIERIYEIRTLMGDSRSITWGVIDDSIITISSIYEAIEH